MTNPLSLQFPKLYFMTLVLFVYCITLQSLDNVVVAENKIETSSEKTIDFSQQIQPILARKCFTCHGPDEGHREADLRLDLSASAIEYEAIVPGKPEESSLIERIFSDDPELIMPPVDSHDQLKEEEKELLKQWIKQGAEYKEHWAFIPPKQPKLPVVKNKKWPRNEIDYFVLARLEKEGLTPAKQADRYTLVRRVYLDLIGLPPTPEQADQFVNSNDPQAYEKLVDHLLSSKHYGERWARLWLDLARYADTNGYEKDRKRSIWPYRDWVIKAINADMPFDQFSIEQLAGDMLPNANLDQQIATGFHRNTMLNEEGGIDPLEYRYYAMVDRVATTGTVWLGLTTGCCQCHSHKYDPISHTDYYRLMALMNNADEPDQIIPGQTVERKQKIVQVELDNAIAELPGQFPAAANEKPTVENRKKYLEQKYQQWLDEQRKLAVKWQTIRPTKMKTNLPRLEVLEDGSIFSTGDITKRDLFELQFSLDDISQSITAIRLEVLPDDRLPARGPGRAYYEGRKGDFFLSELTATHNKKPAPFAGGSVSFGKISIGNGTAEAKNLFDGDGSTGWSTAGKEGEANHLVLTFKEPLSPEGTLAITMLFERHFAASLGRFRFSVATQKKTITAKKYPVEIEELLTRAVDSLSEKDREQLHREFLLVTPELAEARKRIEEIRAKLPENPTTMVLRERPEDNPRKTYRHHRGEYLSPKEEVTAGVPALFPPLEKGEEANRLALAKWLVSEKNPLVARVVVNRQWQAFFGNGIVRSPDDFGTQADLPTHPQLLDWLATEFVKRGWSRKELHRLIVNSATYRQSTQVSEQAHQDDPDNRLLARGPRLRVDAETVRDLLLSASGLLSEKMYGPSVYPPQPGSVTALAYGNMKWPVSKGENRYRRSLYTFSKRTAPFAAFTTFDGPTGENCTVRRDRSNTPLQALTLLNDEMYLEMATALAKMTVQKNQEDKLSANEITRQRAIFLFRRLLTRLPSEHEIGMVINFYNAQLQRLNQSELKAADILGEKEATNKLAAWELVARALMNLDETITSP